MSKPMVCNSCREIIYDGKLQYERREEILRLDRTGRRLGVRRIELLCYDCAERLGAHWSGYNRGQSAMFSAQDGTVYVKGER